MVKYCLSLSYCRVSFPDPLVLGLALCLVLANGMIDRGNISIILKSACPVWLGFCTLVTYHEKSRPQGATALYLSPKEAHVELSWLNCSWAKLNQLSTWTEVTQSTLARRGQVLSKIQISKNGNKCLSFKSHWVFGIQLYWSKKLTNKPWKTEFFRFNRDSEVILNLLSSSVLEGKHN